MKTNFKQYVIAALMLALTSFSFASGEIKGLITDETGAPAMGAIVKVLAGDMVVTGTAADADGKYSIKPIEAGKYDLVITYPQYSMQRVNGVIVIDEDAAYVDVEMKPFGSDSEVVVTAEYNKSVVDRTVYTMKTIGAQEFNTMAISRGDIKSALVAKSSDVYQDPNDGMLYVRGARKEATQYFIDGERMIGSMNVPATAVQSATIITGGIPAQYGDLVGGVVIITTKDYFSGMRDKNMWQREYAERKERESAELKKKEREKQIEEEKQKAKEERERKLKEAEEQK